MLTNFPLGLEFLKNNMFFLIFFSSGIVVIGIIEILSSAIFSITFSIEFKTPKVFPTTIKFKFLKGLSDKYFYQYSNGNINIF